MTKSSGLLPPNHYLAVCIHYLFANRAQWGKDAAVGKTVVSSCMIDRVAAKLGRKLYEVPVGFKYFVDGLLHGTLGLAGEESAGSSFLRHDGTVWTTDKDGIIAALLTAEITAKMKKYPGEIYREGDMPPKWLGRIRESMTRLTPEFSASGTIREYTEDHYLHAASGYHECAAWDSKVATSLLQWQQEIARHWNSVCFGALNVDTHEGRHSFRVELFPGDLNPDQFKVELYANPLGEDGPDLEAMTACKACAGVANLNMTAQALMNGSIEERIA